MKLSVPNSDIARKATQFVADLSPKFLYHHCVRAFLFADALGKRDGLKYDRELLYLGAVMHDLGFTDSFDGKQRFEVEGADAASAFVLKHGLPEEKAEIIWDAIALHTTVGVALRKRPEIALVCLGSAVDIAGRRIDDIGSETVERIVEAYPRLGFKAAVIELLVSYARRNPQVIPFTWMTDVARSHPEIVCPTVQEIVQNSPFLE